MAQDFEYLLQINWKNENGPWKTIGGPRQSLKSTRKALDDYTDLRSDLICRVLKRTVGDWQEITDLSNEKQ